MNKRQQKFFGQIKAQFAKSKRELDAEIQKGILDGSADESLLIALCAKLRQDKYAYQVLQAAFDMEEPLFLKVKNMGENYHFLSDSQDVEPIKEFLAGEGDQYDSFFVLVHEGEYQNIFGMSGIVPELERTVAKLW